MLVGLLAALLASCGVNTGVAVTVRPDGSGTVAVTVRLDKAAQVQVGDLARQLQTSDLAQTGWTVAGPSIQADGNEVVTASKPFGTPAEASRDVAALAGSGPVATRPFQLTVIRRDGFWHSQTVVSGVVDLRCGVACFGDTGLQKGLGSSVGIDVGAASAASGQSPAQALSFAFTIQLPGRARAAGAASVDRGAVTWRPVLGQRTTLAASSRSTNTSAVAVVVGVAGLLLLVIIGAAVVAVRRHRRRRPAASATRGRARAGKHRKSKRTSKAAGAKTSPRRRRRR